MKNINWSGIMKIKEIHHLDSNGNIIFEAFNIKNLLIHKARHHNYLFMNTTQR